MDLTSAVHGDAQQGRLVVPPQVSAVQRVRQEGQVSDHDPVGLPHVVQPLHTHTPVEDHRQARPLRGRPRPLTCREKVM